MYYIAFKALWDSHTYERAVFPGEGVPDLNGGHFEGGSLLEVQLEELSEKGKYAKLTEALWLEPPVRGSHVRVGVPA